METKELLKHFKGYEGRQRRVLRHVDTVAERIHRRQGKLKRALMWKELNQEIDRVAIFLQKQLWHPRYESSLGYVADLRKRVSFEGTAVAMALLGISLVRQSAALHRQEEKETGVGELLLMHLSTPFEMYQAMWGTLKSRPGLEVDQPHSK